MPFKGFLVGRSTHLRIQEGQARMIGVMTPGESGWYIARSIDRCMVKCNMMTLRAVVFRFTFIMSYVISGRVWWRWVCDDSDQSSTMQDVPLMTRPPARWHCRWEFVWRQTFGDDLISVPWFSVMGNHDYQSTDACAMTNKEGCAQVRFLTQTTHSSSEWIINLELDNRPAALRPYLLYLYFKSWWLWHAVWISWWWWSVHNSYIIVVMMADQPPPAFRQLGHVSLFHNMCPQRLNNKPQSSGFRGGRY